MVSSQLTKGGDLDRFAGRNSSGELCFDVDPRRFFAQRLVARERRYAPPVVIPRRSWGKTRRRQFMLGPVAVDEPTNEDAASVNDTTSG
jgi:hypothetical protein